VFYVCSRNTHNHFNLIHYLLLSPISQHCVQSKLTTHNVTNAAKHDDNSRDGHDGYDDHGHELGYIHIDTSTSTSSESGFRFMAGSYKLHPYE